MLIQHNFDDYNDDVDDDNVEIDDIGDNNGINDKKTNNDNKTIIIIIKLNFSFFYQIKLYFPTYINTNMLYMMIYIITYIITLMIIVIITLMITITLIRIILFIFKCYFTGPAINKNSTSIKLTKLIKRHRTRGEVLNELNKLSVFNARRKHTNT